MADDPKVEPENDEIEYDDSPEEESSDENTDEDETESETESKK